jgi:hypothetical protein
VLVEELNGLESVQVDIVMMRTPDGHGRLELTKFRNPKLVEIEPAIAPPNALGLRSVMFTVESVDDSVASLRANGAELVGEVAPVRGQVQALLHARPCWHHRPRWPRNSYRYRSNIATPNITKSEEAVRPIRPGLVVANPPGGSETNSVSRVPFIEQTDVMRCSRGRVAPSLRTDMHFFFACLRLDL